MSTYSVSRRFSLTITHIPSGISVTRGAPEFRSEHEARDEAIKYLKSRLYMVGGCDIKDLKVEYLEGV